MLRLECLHCARGSNRGKTTAYLKDYILRFYLYGYTTRTQRWLALLFDGALQVLPVTLYGA